MQNMVNSRGIDLQEKLFKEDGLIK